MKNITEKHCFAIWLIILLSVISLAHSEITVKADKGWGDAQTSNIKRLCENVLLHFNEQLRDEHKLTKNLNIFYRGTVPIITYTSRKPNDYDIGLAVTGRRWADFSYQFGHEVCHGIQRFEHIDGYNDWFQEAMCELASLWVIGRMGETWAYRAPYPNWVDWRHNLTRVATALMDQPAVQYAGTGEDWIRKWEDKVRDGQFTYETVSQLSYKFLPIFEENPKAWNAVAQLPTSNAKMSEYMKTWYSNVDTEDKRFVRAMAEVMGISVGEPVIVSIIDADIDNNGYVDLSDVLIVRSAIQNSTRYDTDVNNDGVTNELDVLLVKAKALEAIAAAAPSLSRKKKITTWGELKKR